LSPICFEPLAIIFRQTVVYVVRYVYFTCFGVPEHTFRSTRLNINLENCAFLWFVLYNYTTMQGAKTQKTASESRSPIVLQNVLFAKMHTETG